MAKHAYEFIIQQCNNERLTAFEFVVPRHARRSIQRRRRRLTYGHVHSPAVCRWGRHSYEVCMGPFMQLTVARERIEPSFGDIVEALWGFVWST